ncbi:STAS domain-containing protein [Amycolatopsis sp. WQ 127309]|uniref:STAS domain-containing protein n=1 Tax=Amycolatopsis sp. WQ 127309 TaxID=2932773 RepID=UPI001FF54894|nr:STAS domain-containing protein [Amycolatopsis sp. WQ 127309]UOZ04896.1 STAS domain-containing protein [Amycolatopsis sp. WQ 127309]
MHLKINSARPGTAIVMARGEIDMMTAPIFGDALGAVCRTAPSHLIVDLSDVEFVSLSGITALLELERHCRDATVDLSVVASPVVRHILEVLDLDKWFLVTGNTHCSVA